MAQIDLSKLSASQLEELKKQLRIEEESEERRKKNEIEAYKGLVSDSVESAFPRIMEQSASLAKSKAVIFGMFESALQLKRDLYLVKEDGQWSHTFTNNDGTKRITLGTYTIDNYDDTAEAGISMVNEYLDSLADGGESAAQAVKICRSLMAKDKKGNLKPSKILTLRKHALESGNVRFIEGVDVIMNAYKPVPSKQYIKAEYKNAQGAWISVPLGMTEAE